MPLVDHWPRPGLQRYCRTGTWSLQIQGVSCLLCGNTICVVLPPSTYTPIQAGLVPLLDAGLQGGLMGRVAQLKSQAACWLERMTEATAALVPPQEPQVGGCSVQGRRSGGILALAVERRLQGRNSGLAYKAHHRAAIAPDPMGSCCWEREAEFFVVRLHLVITCSRMLFALQREAEQPEGSAPPKGAAAAPAGDVMGRELQGAAATAQEAWNKSSALTLAVAYTMMDAMRVLMIGLAQR